MAYRIMMVQETGEEVCYTSDIETMEIAMDELDFAYDGHPECRFYIEPEHVTGTEPETLTDVPW